MLTLEWPQAGTEASVPRQLGVDDAASNGRGGGSRVGSGSSAGAGTHAAPNKVASAKTSAGGSRVGGGGGSITGGVTHAAPNKVGTAKVSAAGSSKTADPPGLALDKAFFATQIGDSAAHTSGSIPVRWSFVLHTPAKNTDPAVRFRAKGMLPEAPPTIYCSASSAATLPPAQFSDTSTLSKGGHAGSTRDEGASADDGEHAMGSTAEQVVQPSVDSSNIMSIILWLAAGLTLTMLIRNTRRQLAQSAALAELRVEDADGGVTSGEPRPSSKRTFVVAEDGTEHAANVSLDGVHSTAELKQALVALVTEMLEDVSRLPLMACRGSAPAAPARMRLHAPVGWLMCTLLLVLGARCQCVECAPTHPPRHAATQDTVKADDLVIELRDQLERRKPLLASMPFSTVLRAHALRIRKSTAIE